MTIKKRALGPARSASPRMAVVGGMPAACEEVLREAGIKQVPPQIRAYGDHQVRIGSGREDFSRVLSRIGEYLPITLDGAPLLLKPETSA